MAALVPGRGFEPLYAAPKTAVLPLNDPGRGVRRPTEAHRSVRLVRIIGCPAAALNHASPTRLWSAWRSPGSVADLMGSLIKKRRKRMRKKKHKKMLRRTRHQRRK